MRKTIAHEGRSPETASHWIRHRPRAELRRPLRHGPAARRIEAALPHTTVPSWRRGAAKEKRGGRAQGAHVVDGDPTSGQFHLLGCGIVEIGVRHGADEVSVLVMIENGTLVRTGDDEQATIGLRHLVDADADGEQVIIRVRVERPVLVPFHGAARFGAFDIEFVAVVAHTRRAHQLRDDVEDLVIVQSPLVDIV